MRWNGFTAKRFPRLARFGLPAPGTWRKPQRCRWPWNWISAVTVFRRPAGSWQTTTLFSDRDPVAGWSLARTPKGATTPIACPRPDRHARSSARCAGACRIWIRHPFVFLGMIGSRRKARVIREQFVRQNIATADQMARVACPVGVDIRAQTTREIAVSIMGRSTFKNALN